MGSVTLYDEVALKDQADPAPPVFSRAQLIREILEMNASVSPEFLDSFSERRLRSYRDHLVWSKEPREIATPWTDPDRTAAVAFAEAPE
jgi:hypothetical protein